MGQRKPRKRQIEGEPQMWMLERLEHQFLTGGDLMCYGSRDLMHAATSGAINVLLLCPHECSDALIEETLRHGGRVVRVSEPNAALTALGIAALLHYNYDIIEEACDAETAEASTGSSSAPTTLPLAPRWPPILPSRASTSRRTRCAAGAPSQARSPPTARSHTATSRTSPALTLSASNTSPSWLAGCWCRP